jgi:hypothetical protein
LRRERIEALEAELDEENAVREDKRAEAKTATDPELRTELWISRIMAEATRNRGNGPGQKIPQDDPQEIQARNEEFDRQREEALRGSILISRRTLYALTHSIPGGWSNDDKYDDHFPPELRFARLRDEQTIS